MIIDELFEAPQQCPECGGISFSDLILAEKKDACYHKVKASAKVWPSAYASGRLVQCRKKGAANYGNKSEGVAEAGFPGAPDVEMPPMNPSGDPQRDKLKQEYMDLHREIKSLVDLQYRSTSDEQKMQAKARIEQLNDRADQIKAILEPRQPPNEWQKKTYGFDDNWNKVNQGVAEGQLELNTPDPVVVVQDLKGNILDKINLSVAAQKYKLGQPQTIKNQLAHQNYTKVGNYTIVSPMSGQPQDATTQGVAETELDEKSVSQAQFRTMAGAAHNPEFARKVGISQDVAQEFNQADKHSNYKKLPDRATEGEQKKPKEEKYGPEYDDMVARVKKLAGLGPMKTVYDPNKRVYRNVPTAVQPKK